MDICSPITPTTFIKSLKGKSLPQLIRFSDGNDYVIKFSGNPQGMKILINEYIASQLAAILSLSTPSYSLVHISEQFIRENPVLSSFSFVGGVQFSSRYIEHCKQIPKYPPFPERDQILNQEVLAGIVVFDYWLSNSDRSRRNLLLQQNHRGNVQIQLIDHGNCFSGNTNWDVKSLVKPPKLKFRTVHKWCLSLLRNKDEILLFIEKVKKIPDDLIYSIIGSIPDEWNVTKREKESLYTYLVKGKTKLPNLLDQISSTYFIPKAGFKAMKHHNRDQVLGKLKNAIDNHLPLSLVRIGNGENIVLAQYSILPEEKFMKTGTARKWPKHGAGMKLPDIKARDEVLESLKKVDLVGILPTDDNKVKTNPRYKRELTDQIFNYHHFYPQHTFDALLFRDLPGQWDFWRLMKGKRIIIISKWGEKFRKKCDSFAKQFGFNITTVYPIHNYYEIPKVLSQLDQADFDIALIAAGVGAIVLSQKISERYGKIAIDMGHGLTRFAKGKLELPKPDHIE